MRELIIYPDDLLKQKCEPVDGPAKYEELVEEMREIMIKNDGVGLAGPQVGELVRVFLMDEGWQPGKPAPEQERKIRAYFNPEIIEIEEREEITEACLSFPGISIEVERGHKVKFRALDLEGKEVEKTVENLQAQCVQHESEHLEGITLADHASLSEKIEMQEKLEEYKKEN
ncbi:MAG: peptide deformylase [bacterium]